MSESVLIAIIAVIGVSITALASVAVARIGKNANGQGSALDAAFKRIGLLETKVEDLDLARKADRRSFRAYVTYLLDLLEQHAPHVKPNPMPDDLHD